jgi:hypothetical protein
MSRKKVIAPKARNPIGGETMTTTRLFLLYNTTIYRGQQIEDNYIW